ncbi:hypothetical protein CP967_31185 [Streptomyces nitrosporeus]|uniref:SprT-like domain-containing protein n=1 Tax=Streptomyces nitrosporeus TaxID=28894 RepID=A0A5J6FIM7_9ACTN|nr:hypothetical protein CP967_31185 [Streptomyces nitrosporeus]
MRDALPDLPAARLDVSTAPPSATHDGASRLAWAGDVVTGLVISAETLKEGGACTVETILHEAAHVLCWIRGVQETTIRGAYHNRAFLTAAEETGLHWPAGMVRTGARGYATPALTPGARNRYASDIVALDDVIPRTLPLLPVPEAPARHRTPDRLTMQCGCTPPRKMKMSPTVAALGPVTCGVCGKPFTTQ